MRLAATEKAEAGKILQVKRAEGEAEAKYLSSMGIARQRQAIVDGLRDSVLGFSVNVPGTSAKDVMDMVLVTQYFDTMKCQDLYKNKFKDILRSCGITLNITRTIGSIQEQIQRYIEKLRNNTQYNKNNMCIRI